MNLRIQAKNLSPKTEKLLRAHFSDYERMSPRDALLSQRPFSRVLLCASLNETGYDRHLLDLLHRAEGARLFEDTVAGVVVESPGPLYTREAGVQLLYHANRLGARMPGRSLVEATPGLENLVPLSRPLGKSPEDILSAQLKGLHERMGTSRQTSAQRRLSVWTIGKPDTSATLAVWDMIRPHLNGIEIDLLSFGQENIRDCRGCAYELCKKMGEETRCIYEDYVVKEMYPSIERSDGILILTPNYNDMLPANFVSSINRLTALFRKRKFFDKSLFSLIVTGHSGAELLSRQLIGALHINKTFALPPRFTWEVRAHNRDAVRENRELPQQAEAFAKRIVAYL